MMNHSPPMGGEKPGTQLRRFLGWLAQARLTHYDLALMRRDRRGRKRVFLAPDRIHADQLTQRELCQRLPWLRAENANGADIYFRPHRYSSWPVVFLDDLPTSTALKIAAKYRAAVIETSRGSCHLWLHVAEPLNEQMRCFVQKDLVAKLGDQADKGSVSGEHLGRLPGFRNHKPGRNCWVNLKALSQGPSYQPGVQSPATNWKTTATITTKASSCPDFEQVRAEWGWVMGCLEQGAAPTALIDTLIRRAEKRRDRRASVKYAYYTVRKACRRVGIQPP